MVIAIWGTALKLYSDQGTDFTGQVLQQVCTIWAVLQYFHCTQYPQHSGLIECTDGLIKTQLAKFLEILQIPWPKSLRLVLQNLRSTPFGTHKLSLFEIVTGYPMHLAPASFDPQLIKGDILQYCKGLIVSIKDNHVLLEQFFHSVLPGDWYNKDHNLQSGDFVYWKLHLQKDSLQPRWKGLYQVLLGTSFWRYHLNTFETYTSELSHEFQNTSWKVDGFMRLLNSKWWTRIM